MARFVLGPVYKGVDIMSRLVFGPQYSGVVVAPAPLPDVVVVASSAGAVGRTATVTIPAFDPATSNPPVGLYACYVAVAPDPASDVKAFLDSVPAANVGHSTAIAVGDVAITVPGVPAGTYTVQFVVEYAS